MATYLITGGAGFIGSNYLLTRVPNHPSNRYVCLDALTYAGNREYLKPIEHLPNFHFVEGSINDESLVDTLFNEERFDYVINFAAESHVDNSIQGPKVFFETNVLGTEVLLDACRKYGITRFHQVSTDEVYGDAPLDSDIRFHEDSPLHPSSPYAASKASADLLVMSYKRTYGLNVSISRCSNNYGPNQHKEKLIPMVIDKAKHDQNIPIFGDGKNMRDWIHVDDHNDAIDLIIQKGVSGGVYNVSAHNEIANIDLAKSILKELDKPESLLTYVPDRLGHDVRYPLDTKKIEELGWKAKHTCGLNCLR